MYSYKVLFKPAFVVVEAVNVFEAARKIGERTDRAYEGLLIDAVVKTENPPVPVPQPIPAPIPAKAEASSDPFDDL